MQLEVLEFGGIVRSLLTPDREGHLGDVVLGYEHLDPYLVRHPYFGAITGRVAGRLTNARFTLDGHTYELAANDGPHHIHGGLVGLDRRLWQASPESRPDGTECLTLTYRSPDGEEGYPGNLDLQVTYSVTPDNELLIETEVQTDRTTPVNLTHHGYFNLAGDGDIRDHQITIFADSYFPFLDDFSLADREDPVDGTGEDLRRPTRVEDALPQLFGSHGSLYRVRRSVADTTPTPAARVCHPASGRVLDVRTTEQMLQFYTGSMLTGNGPAGKTGHTYQAHAGLCLECQGYTNGVTIPHLGDILVHPGQPSRNTTIYAFSTEPNPPTTP